jgi:hypothetical protein
VAAVKERMARQQHGEDFRRVSTDSDQSERRPRAGTPTKLTVADLQEMDKT